MIVGLTQFIVYYYLFQKFGSQVSLNGYLLYLFILDTMLIAAGGYIINDIVDYRADVINKPQKTFLQTDITTFQAYVYYYVVLLFGMALAIFLGYQTNNLPLISLYPLACGVLYLYSTKYKNSILIGNIIVSIFVAFVPGIILVAERSLLFANWKNNAQSDILSILLFYISFSFLVNLVREIVKDIEDIHGDTQTGYVTLPIKYGVNVAKKWGIVLTIITIFLLFIWLFVGNVNIDFRAKSYFLLLVAAPLIIVTQIMTKTTQKRDFSKISTILKWTMLAGLGGIVLISNSL